MKTFLALLCIALSSSVFYSCSDTPVVNENNTLSGAWKVDKVQLVSAPTNGTASAMMKQLLVPFGEISAGTAGYLDFNFGSETMAPTATNLRSNHVHQFKFYNNFGYAVTYTDSLRVTTDGGITWINRQLPEVNNESRLIATASGNIVYTMADTGLYRGPAKLYKSTDQGASWIMVNALMPFVMNSSLFNGRLNFINENTGYGLGETPGSGGLFKTINGGVNWVQLPGVHSGFFKMQFFDEMNGWAEDYIGGQNVSSITGDGGVTWSNFPLPADFNIREYYFLNKNIGWLYGTFKGIEPGLFKTTDGGKSWVKINGGIEFTGAFTFRTETEGYACTPNGFMKTADGGVNWFFYSVNEFTNPQAVFLINNDPVFFSYNSSFYKPTGVINPLTWTASGRVTNPAMKLITGANDNQTFAAGSYNTGGSDFSIHFNSSIYSGGNGYAEGGGQYSFENGALIITMNLPNSEVWKIRLVRK